MEERTPDTITIGFIPLGCPKAIIDSEAMLGRIAQAGFVVTGETEDVDVVIINTCGFIESAKQEAMETIGSVLERKKAGSVGRVIVTGCLPERMGKKMLKELPELDGVVNLSGREDIVDIIVDVLGSFESKQYLGEQGGRVFDDRARLRITPAHWAYLRISEGCDHKCSFCTIPRIRGRFRSKPVEQVLREASELASAGVRELNIVAQDTAYYGKDLGMKNGLSLLIKELDKNEGIEWLRLMYLYPVGVTDKLLDTILSSEKTVPYFDIPIQHINNDILKAMRRPENKELITNLFEKIRGKFETSVLRTTVILGFPGETEQQFRELLDFIKQMRFDALGAFTYYREKGTKAYHLPAQVDEETKRQRFDEVMHTQREIAFEKNKQRVGKVYKILIESPPDEQGVAAGRYFGQAPEIDSICYVRDCTASQGEFVRGEIISGEGYDLVVREIKD